MAVKVQCKNCGESVQVPDLGRPKITLFSFRGLFSESGVLIVLIICGLGLPALLGVFSRDLGEYEGIKKALETPGVKLEVSKDDKGKVDWKITKGPEGAK